MNPVEGYPALYIENEEILVIADLHIGIEYEFWEKGINMGTKTDKIIEDVKKVISKVGARKLLIIGDLKHSIPSSPRTEVGEVERFVREVSQQVDIMLVPGNHDGNIEDIVSDSVKVLPSHGVVINSTGFVHGHRWPHEDVMLADTLVVAHTHPTFSLKDSFGYRFIERCWVIAKPNIEELESRYQDVNIQKIIVIPAFNQLCGGVCVNEEGFIGVVDKIISKKDIEIFLLDGTYLGMLNR